MLIVVIPKDSGGSKPYGSGGDDESYGSGAKNTSDDCKQLDTVSKTSTSNLSDCFYLKTLRTTVVVVTTTTVALMTVSDTSGIPIGLRFDLDLVNLVLDSSKNNNNRSENYGGSEDCKYRNILLRRDELSTFGQ